MDWVGSVAVVFAAINVWRERAIFVRPLLCGGITVFAPLLDEQVSPMAHVAVVGIGGLGHMALQFARAWGCEVTALTTDLSKADEARGFGAHNVMLLEELPALAGRFNLVINTVNQPLEWSAVMGSLAPRGRLHQLGAVLQPIQVGAFDLISFRRSITGSPTSSPESLRKMMEFCVSMPSTPRLSIFRLIKSIKRLSACIVVMCATALCLIRRPNGGITVQHRPF